MKIINCFFFKIINIFKKQNHYVKYLLYAFAFAILMSTFMNIAFYKYVIANGIGVKMAIACFFVLLSNYMAIFFALSFRYVGKYILYILTCIACVSEIYMLSSNAPISYATIKSIFGTHVAEATELIDIKLILSSVILFIVILPFFYKAKIHCIIWYKEIIFRIFCLFFSLFFGFGTIYLNYVKFASFSRQNENFGCFINIDNFVFNTFLVIKNSFNKPKVLNILDEKPIKKKTNKNRFVVLLIGETSRKASYSLNGYKRKTNPKLEKEDIINFTNATSCGTYTAHSVPCMFSFKTRKTYKESELNENVLDILLKTGVSVAWYENDDSCDKEQANNKKIEYTNLKYRKHPLCKNGRCFDEVLIEDLNNEINNFIKKKQKDKVIVLHMIGSHGPLYYKRYPRKWAFFQPECTNANPSICSIEELKNAYDNTILYQDYVLSEIINVLKSMKKKQSEIDITMIYVSDHGESLGEKGYFMHAFPYRLAPKEQIEIPFIVWTSDNNLKKKFNLKKDSKISHDNLSHTLLGIFDVISTVKNNDLDLTK